MNPLLLALLGQMVVGETIDLAYVLPAYVDADYMEDVAAGAGAYEAGVYEPGVYEG